MATEKKVQRYVTIFFIAFVGGFITKLPYIMGSYYTALELATGATRMQLGMLSTIYGIVNFIVYLPGGYLADRVSAKKLVVIGALGTAVFGLWYAALPGFIWLLVIHMGFAVTSVFIFWAAMVKAVNNLGTDAEQGKMFGFLEGSRYLVGILAMYGSIAVFGQFTDEVAGFKGSSFITASAWPWRVSWSPYSSRNPSGARRILRRRRRREKSFPSSSLKRF
ncbi:hypothetical protein FACS1894130_13520 [Spirochaetia bacterium]|nr:hypothetical protein FACS1894130_13520 [Spirochaetia bacterium]